MIARSSAYAIVVHVEEDVFSSHLRRGSRKMINMYGLVYLYTYFSDHIRCNFFHLYILTLVFFILVLYMCYLILQKKNMTLDVYKGFLEYVVSTLDLLRKVHPS